MTVVLTRKLAIAVAVVVARLQLPFAVEDTMGEVHVDRTGFLSPFVKRWM